MKKDVQFFGKRLKTWEAVISCNLNPIKTKTLQNSLEKLLQIIIRSLDLFKIEEEFIETVFNFEKILVQTNQVNTETKLE